MAFTANPVGANRRWNWFSRVTYFSAAPSDCERCPRERHPFCRISPTGHTDAPTQSARLRHEDAAGEKRVEEARKRRREREGCARKKPKQEKKNNQRKSQLLLYFVIWSQLIASVNFWRSRIFLVIIIFLIIIIIEIAVIRYKILALTLNIHDQCMNAVRRFIWIQVNHNWNKYDCHTYLSRQQSYMDYSWSCEQLDLANNISQNK